MPSSLQKLKEKCRSSTRRLSGGVTSSSSRTNFTQRSDSAPSCLYDASNRVNMAFVQTAPTTKKSCKPLALTKTPSLKRGRSSGTILPPPDFTPTEAPIPRTSLDLLVSTSSKRRRLSVCYPSLATLCENDNCSDEECLLCSLARPELKRRHSIVFEPSTFRNFY